MPCQMLLQALPDIAPKPAIDDGRVLTFMDKALMTARRRLTAKFALTMPSVYPIVGQFEI